MLSSDSIMIRCWPRFYQLSRAEHSPRNRNRQSVVNELLQHLPMALDANGMSNSGAGLQSTSGNQDSSLGSVGCGGSLAIEGPVLVSKY